MSEIFVENEHMFGVDRCYVTPKTEKGAGYPVPFSVEMCVEVVEVLKMAGFCENGEQRAERTASVHNAE